MVVEQGSARPKIPRLSYEYFSRTVDPITRERVGYVPLERAVIFPGVVTFNESDYVLDLGSGPGDSMDYLMSSARSCVRDKIHWLASEPSVLDCEVIRGRFGGRVGVANLDAVAAVKYAKNYNKIFFINGIHLLSPQGRAELFKSIRPGQEFTFTSTFIEEGLSSKVQEEVIAPWIETLFSEARDHGLDRRAMVKKMREVKEQTWSMERYKEELNNAAFNVRLFALEEMPCTWESYRTISHFPPFVKNIFPDEVSDRTAAVLSFRALMKTMHRLGKNWNDPAPRNTLVVVVRKAT